MKVIEVKEFGDPEVMELVEKPVPAAGIGEVVVQVKAIGVNPVETSIRAGTYPKLPDVGRARPYSRGKRLGWPGGGTTGQGCRDGCFRYGRNCAGLYAGAGARRGGHQS